MSGFDLQIAGVGDGRFDNCATTTAQDCTRSLINVHVDINEKILIALLNQTPSIGSYLS